MRVLLLILLMISFACNPSRHATTITVPSGDSTKTLPFVNRLAETEGVKEAYLKGKKNAKFYVEDLTDVEWDEEIPMAMRMVTTAEADNASGGCNDPMFHGSDRMEAKLVFNKANQTKKEKLQHLVDRLLASEQQMLHHDPELTEASDCKRVQEEMENVYLDHVFIYLIIREGDGDYHLIIGDGQHTAPENLMNVEISALPDQSSFYYAKLASVRDKFETYKDGRYKLCSAKSFLNSTDRPEISIKGTLFYDIRHAKRNQHSGSGNIKPKTFWEIHPVTYIKFWN